MGWVGHVALTLSNKTFTLRFGQEICGKVRLARFYDNSFKKFSLKIPTWLDWFTKEFGCRLLVKFVVMIERGE
jgi:hypothetical protein